MDLGFGQSPEFSRFERAVFQRPYRCAAQPLHMMSSAKEELTHFVSPTFGHLDTPPR
jgi:hypothetical protein